MLVPAATVTDHETAQLVRMVLRDNGIRATAGPAARARRWGGRVVVLVFPEDARRAYEVLCGHTR
ncbi:hypothetical protein [Nocardia farcinica]|uniref:hypothetical protein n=1 Tax=Nocardia farcinica TaxID=37329 RepID=UPI00245636B3|nr:hypothetical protein [Nocardia farcinica]